MGSEEEAELIDYPVTRVCCGWFGPVSCKHWLEEYGMVMFGFAWLVGWFGSHMGWEGRL